MKNIDKDKELVLKVMPMPSYTNIHGDIFGGWICLKLI